MTLVYPIIFCALLFLLPAFDAQLNDANNVGNAPRAANPNQQNPNLQLPPNVQQQKVPQQQQADVRGLNENRVKQGQNNIQDVNQGAAGQQQPQEAPRQPILPAGVPDPKGPRVPGAGGLADSVACSYEVDRHCRHIPRGSDIAILQCLQDAGDTDDVLTTGCQQVRFKKLCIITPTVFNREKIHRKTALISTGIMGIKSEFNSRRPISSSRDAILRK